MSADTGVGPSMASGSHTCSGSCADLPAAPTSSNRVMAVAPPVVRTSAASSKTVPYEKVPNVAKITIIPTRNPKSPMRLTTNAFLPAAAADGLSIQNEISR